MGHRLTKIYTRTGDNGTTSVDGHTRVNKDSPIIETLGCLDELNSAIGIVIVSLTRNSQIKEVLLQIQQDLFNLGGELCQPSHPVMTDEKILQIEKWLDEWNATLPPLKEFILPGGNLQSALSHLTRAICRRTERSLVSLNKEQTLSPALLGYINRVSDLLFVIARVLASETKSDEILWEHERKRK